MTHEGRTKDRGRGWVSSVRAREEILKGRDVPRGGESAGGWGGAGVSEAPAQRGARQGLERIQLLTAHLLNNPGLPSQKCIFLTFGFFFS